MGICGPGLIGADARSNSTINSQYTLHIFTIATAIRKKGYMHTMEVPGMFGVGGLPALNQLVISYEPGALSLGMPRGGTLG